MAPNGKDTSILTYRQLPGEEWSRLSPIFVSRGWRLPNPILSGAFVAEAQGQIVGGELLQTVLHAEPTWVEEGWHGRVNVLRLNRMVDATFTNPAALCPGYLVVASTPEVERLCEIAKMVEVPGKIYRRSFAKQV